MSVNIFGFGPKENYITDFKYLDKDGNYDINNKRLRNLGKASDANDAVSKNYIDNKYTVLNNYLNGQIELINERIETVLKQLIIDIADLKRTLNIDIEQGNNKVSELGKTLGVDILKNFEQINNLKSSMEVIESNSHDYISYSALNNALEIINKDLSESTKKFETLSIELNNYKMDLNNSASAVSLINLRNDVRQSLNNAHLLYVKVNDLETKLNDFVNK